MKHKYEKEQFSECVKKSESMGHLLELLGIIKAGGNYATMKRRILTWNIDTSHWELTKRKRQGYKNRERDNSIPLYKILIENSSYTHTYCLKNKLIKEKVFELKCYRCELTNWLDRSIPLELEHINGNRADNRIENLTLLCPNCHALTNTYRGKNKRK